MTQPAWRPLDPHQRRVLGVLIEKAKTTPGAYPMSVNAIVTGCNQRNNREPIMSLDESDVERALDGLRTLKAASEMDWLGRVPKHRHHAYEWLGVSKAELAVLGELLLRGPQTLGELRSRAARMEPIADLAALKPIVDGLLERGLMIALSPPGRGQIVTHRLYPPDEMAALEAPAGDHRPRETSTDAPAAVADGLRAEVAQLRSELARLRARVAELESRFTGPGR